MKSDKNVIGQDKVLMDMIVREDCNRTEQSTNGYNSQRRL